VSEAIESTSIGRSHGRLTGPIFLRAVDQLRSLEFRSARSKDWPVNREACVTLRRTGNCSGSPPGGHSAAAYLLGFNVIRQQHTLMQAISFIPELHS
jgi:hypothetical protein